MRNLLLYFLFASCTLSAQSLDSLINRGDALYVQTNKELFFPVTGKYSQDLLFFSELDTSRNSHYLKLELLELERKQLRQDMGLQFKASANYNFRDVIDEETNNFNLGTIRAELEWNVLKSGYTTNRTKERIAENKINIQRNLLHQNEKALKRRRFRIDYTYVINKEKLHLLNQYRSFQNAYFDYLNQLYFQKYIKRETLIEVSSEIASLENEIEILSKENLTIQDSISQPFFNIETLPLINLNLNSIQLEDSLLSSTFSLASENIELEHKALNDLSLSFYIQENYNYSRIAHRFFPAVGFRFKAPIRFNKRKKIIDVKVKILHAEMLDQSVGRKNRLITIIKSYNEKVKDVNSQYKNWNILEERARILSVLKSEIDDKNTGFLLLEITNEKFKVLLNLLQLKRQLYNVMSNVLEVADWEFLKEVITEFQFEKNKQIKKDYLISSNASIPLKTQLNYYLLNKGKISLTVYEGDIEAQKKLRDQGIEFTVSQRKVDESIAEELEKSARKLNIIL